MGDLTTQNDAPEALLHSDVRLPLALGLAHYPTDPGRVGEIAWLTHTGDAVLGREGDLTFGQHRPGVERGARSLDDAAISRQQATFHRTPSGAVHVVRTGRLVVRVNGLPTEKSPLRAGDVIELGTRVVLLVHKRPASLPGTASHRFGVADEHGLVGEGPAAWALRARVKFVGERQPHVLVHGPSGSGKELVARAVHACSGRQRHPFVSRNAATIPESLADAELFGNLRNYPNPGMPDRPGLVGEAHRGVLFLDEFGELPVDAQAKLLRVLDGGEYSRLGEAGARHADVRLVAATNRDPAALKHDLLARLLLRVQTPPLATRREDIGLLVRHLLRTIAEDDPHLGASLFEDGDADRGAPRVTSRLVATLVAHPYQTGIRELHRLLWEAIGAREDETHPLDLFPDYDRLIEHPTPMVTGPVDPALLTPETIQACLDRYGGRQEPAWRELGLSSRYALSRLVKRHGLRVRGARSAGTDD